MRFLIASRSLIVIWLATSCVGLVFSAVSRFLIRMKMKTSITHHRRVMYVGMPPNGVWDRTLVAFEFTDNDDAPCACFWELDLDDYDPYCDPMYEAPVGSWYIVDM